MHLEMPIGTDASYVVTLTPTLTLTLDLLNPKSRTTILCQVLNHSDHYHSNIPKHRYIVTNMIAISAPTTLLTAKPKHRLGRALFLLKKQTGFWPSYCQISTDVDRILHTPIVVRNIRLWADLDRDRRVDGSNPNQNDYVFGNTCNTP